VQYEGFIRTIMSRSEMLLDARDGDELNITRLLLLLNTGFALVWERLRYWEEQDPTNDRRRCLGFCDLKASLNANFGQPIDLRGTSPGAFVFETFRETGDWAYLTIEPMPVGRRLSTGKFLDRLRQAHVRPANQVKLKELLTAIRNSFAHGGILPMSRDQASCPRFVKPDFSSRSGEIDRIYFVSRLTGDTSSDVRGLIVVEFGPLALARFWDDWKQLMLVQPRPIIDSIELDAA
jgi:hypothetical protein